MRRRDDRPQACKSKSTLAAESRIESRKVRTPKNGNKGSYVPPATCQAETSDLFAPPRQAGWVRARSLKWLMARYPGTCRWRMSSPAGVPIGNNTQLHSQPHFKDPLHYSGLLGAKSTLSKKKYDRTKELERQSACDLSSWGVRLVEMYMNC